MKQSKRMLALLLAAVLCLACLPAAGTSARAEEAEKISGERKFSGEMRYLVNQTYRDVVTEEMIADAVTENAKTDVLLPENDYGFPEFENCTEAVVYIRNGMKKHEESIVFELKLYWEDEEQIEERICEMVDLAYTHTGVPTEGDYIRYDILGWGYGYACESAVSVIYNVVPAYAMTPEEAEETDAAFAAKLSEWNLSGEAPYDKVSTVYNWVAENILYDYENLDRFENDYENFDCWEMYSPYGLVTGTCVCQGFAAIMYRFMLELGIDCRIITGMNHAWNIVKLGDYWYNLDSTWESNYREEGYTDNYWFLKCPEHFSEHIRYEEYTTPSFMENYPMAPECYDPTVSAEIVLQPDDVYMMNGRHGVFCLKAKGFGLTYQWQWKNGDSFVNCEEDPTGKLIGARKPELSVEANAETDGRQYRCIVTDGRRNVCYSDVATMHVGSIAILTQPEDATACVGDETIFTIEVLGTELKYEWSYTDDGTVFYAIGGQTGNTLKVTCMPEHDGRGYRCRVYDGSGNQVFSRVAYLTVRTVRTVTHISIPCGRIVAGKTPAETFRFEEYEKEFAEQGVQLAYWDAVCTDTWEFVGMEEAFEEGLQYYVYAGFEALPNYELTKDTTADFSGAAEFDHGKYDANWGNGLFVASSVPVRAEKTKNIDVGFSATCSFDERLAVNFYVPETYLAGYENVRLEVIFESWTGSTVTLKAPAYVTGLNSTYNGAPARKFTFSGISAPEVGNLIRATVIAWKEGIPYRSRTVEYSISKYCYNMLKDGSGADAGLKKLCVNVLNYASAAQTYFNMNPGSLVNAQLTDAQKALAGGSVAVTARASKTQISGAKKLEGISAKVNMASAPELIFDLTLKSGVDPSSLSVSYSYESLTGKKTVSGYIPVTEARGGNVYRVKLDGFASADMRQPVTVKVLEGDTPVYDIITYSLECYCTSMLGTAITDANRAEMTKLQPLCRQMMNYSNAAKEYFVK